MGSFKSFLTSTFNACDFETSLAFLEIPLPLSSEAKFVISISFE